MHCCYQESEDPGFAAEPAQRKAAGKRRSLGLRSVGVVVAENSAEAARVSSSSSLSAGDLAMAGSPALRCGAQRSAHGELAVQPAY